MKIIPPAINFPSKKKKKTPQIFSYKFFPSYLKRRSLFFPTSTFFPRSQPLLRENEKWHKKNPSFVVLENSWKKKRGKILQHRYYLQNKIIIFSIHPYIHRKFYFTAFCFIFHRGKKTNFFFSSLTYTFRKCSKWKNKILKFSMCWFFPRFFPSQKK